MPIVGGLDIHRRQITFDYLDTVTGQVCRGQVCPADREHLRAWLARFAGRDGVAFAAAGCTGWRYVAEELAAAGITAHLPGYDCGRRRAPPGRYLPAPRLQRGRLPQAASARFTRGDENIGKNTRDLLVVGLPSLRGSENARSRRFARRLR